jgi:hypothetical protein
MCWDRFEFLGLKKKRGKVAFKSVRSEKKIVTL